MSETEVVAWYPIGAVARKTGLTVHTLRAWERRYGVIEPRRSGGGTRLYSSGDISRLRLLRRATEAGHTIGQVASLPVDDLRSLLMEEEPLVPTSEGSSGDSEAKRIVAEIIAAVELMDGIRIQSLLMSAVVALPVRRVIEQVIVPVLREVGDRWAAGTICPANEHLLSANVRRVLAWLTDAVAVPPGAPAVVVTTPSGHLHELGAQIAGVIAAEAGWRVVFLGPSLPAGDIARAVEITGSRMVLLGATVGEEERLVQELRGLMRNLGEGVTVVVGGRGAEPIEAKLARMGVTVVNGFGPLERLLREEHAGSGRVNVS